MIQEGDTVVIRMHDDKSSHFLRVRGEQKIGKLRIPMKPLIGHPFESVFELQDKVIVRVKDDPAFLEKAFDEVGNGIGIGGNNSSYVDTNTAQKLSDIDIQALKDSGATGVDIMKSLIANSETWKEKTEFAQQKWLTRKSRKYLRRFRVCKSTPSLLCDVMFNKSNDNICSLRGDSLAQILSHGGVYPGARVLVCESTLGLISGSAAYRMRGVGRILSLFTGQQPHLEYVEQLNLSDKDLGIIRPIPLQQLAPAADFVITNGFQATDSNAMDTAPPSPKPNSNRPNGKPHHSSCMKPYEIERAKLLLRQGVNSLLIVSRYRPLSVLQEAVYLLAPSSPFAVHCEYLEPLVECYLFLSAKNIAVRMILSDTWMREYQTLPGRLHPHMNMSASGGFLLTGIYIGSLVVRSTQQSAEDTTTMPSEMERTEVESASYEEGFESKRQRL